MSLWEYANPVKFLKLSDKVLPFFVGFSIIGLSIGLFWGFFFTPDDYRQGSTVKIIYLHVPSALMAINAWFMMLVASLIWLVRRHHVSALAAKAAAPVGVTMTMVALVTGALWGQPMWGTWWVWDARLTSVAILFMIYLIIIFMNLSFENRIVREKVVAIFILVGSVNLPIVKFSVDWWNTLHQPATISKLSKPSIDPSMMTPLIIMTFAFIMIGIAIAILRIKTEIISRKSYLS